MATAHILKYLIPRKKNNNGSFTKVLYQEYMPLVDPFLEICQKLTLSNKCSDLTFTHKKYKCSEWNASLTFLWVTDTAQKWALTEPKTIQLNNKFCFEIINDERVFMIVCQTSHFSKPFMQKLSKHILILSVTYNHTKIFSFFIHIKMLLKNHETNHVCFIIFIKTV